MMMMIAEHYSKPPFGGPKAVLAYLSRYTHRDGLILSPPFAPVPC
jgi:hypothetical protein